jgi:uncharacterized membrane protein
MDGSIYLLAALLLGVIAGLRTFPAPAVVAWAVHLGRLDLTGRPLALLGNPWVRWPLTLFVLVELVFDQLPSSPSRTTPPQFAGRLISGALVGTAVGAAVDHSLLGAMAAVGGAIIGTLGGSRARAWLARTLRSDHPAGFIEDVVAIGGALLIGFAGR